jgi:hypothetical protein
MAEAKHSSSTNQRKIAMVARGVMALVEKVHLVLGNGPDELLQSAIQTDLLVH